jgi:hypothetical protein
VPYAGKNDLSRQSNTTWADILRTGKKETNLENPSTTNNIAKLPLLVRVRGPTKSINNLSTG